VKKLASPFTVTVASWSGLPKSWISLSKTDLPLQKTDRFQAPDFLNTAIIPYPIDVGFLVVHG
jgi:hypothetical protein